ncbi:ABC transporter ATP-binding protein [Microbacterium sp. Clip185]|uniref:ABC transporter ATP-binding protein n=1 Tax=Microbacterium sp. Clip185 TaxID=3025663 RepID=UPI0023654B04|nr:ABC transporter ATP-binding protein [Microbacterium sp. Clip185]WDG18348.1 ABC transporter ATP-binding protein [Microbacterium sp. Clip185]
MTFSPTPGLRLNGLSKRLGGRTVVDDLHLDIAQGELVSLLGPSGCGKTTTLRMIAGFLSPDAGRVEVAGEDVTSLGPERRPSAMVFQNYALWPHMTVAKNVGFPLRIARVPRAEITRRVDEALELVGLSHHARSRPARISGGEQQRASLARALVRRPALLLLDEPLSNLDAKLRVRVREEIRDIQQRLGITTVLVTHDQDEAMAVSDRIAVMNGGRIEQIATPSELYRRPATEFVAGFVGAANLLSSLDLDAGEDGVRWLVRPEHVVIGGDGIPAHVVRTVPRGHLDEVVLSVRGATVRALVGDRSWRPGDEVRVRWARALRYRDGVLDATSADTVAAVA